jgi:hypothetical protein
MVNGIIPSNLIFKGSYFSEVPYAKSDKDKLITLIRNSNALIMDEKEIKNDGTWDVGFGIHYF